MHVFDGDTVKLENGAHVRLLGINTPEMNYETRQPEPYAKNARQFLEQLIKGRVVGLHYDQEKTDRYQRKLAHLFLKDGTNLQYQLLSEGLAYHISVPPNLKWQSCYLNAEKKARLSQYGLWSKNNKPIIEAANAPPNLEGFQLIKGTVTKLAKNNRGFNLELDEKISLFIPEKFLGWFKLENIEGLRNKTLIARGWMYHTKELNGLTIKHPASIEIIDPSR